MNGKVPSHIVIIPDGNRRWAKEKGWEGTKGHEKSTEFEKVTGLLDEAKKLGVKYFSLWGFSTENWKRIKIERDIIFGLVFKLVEKLRGYAKEKQIKFRFIGREDRLPKNLVNLLKDLQKETEKNKELNVQLFLDYGGRDEIIRAVNKVLKEKKKEIDEEEFARHLDTKEIPDPDMIIRTGGEKRLSGLMSYQSAYSELYFTDVYFPDFGPKELREAVEWFYQIERRFGGNR